MVVEGEEDLQGHGWITSEIGPASNSISSSEQQKTESFGDHVFRETLTCRPNGLQAMGHR